MINLTIDGRPISVPKGTTVYHAAKQLGIEIPVFCYLDRMPPFGACRMCLVEVEKMGKLQTSCTLEATEGMVVKTQSAIAAEGRQDILEYLLINHPLDCPVCDRGGECPLQDNTMKAGPGKSRFYEEKRKFKKPIPLSPVLLLDRERCIVCARCTRFCDNLSGDHALEFIDRGFKTEVGTPDGGTAESKFIGNTIFICPVGALTSKVYRFRARPWDNKPTETSCTLCPVGCSIYFDQRDGEIMRTRSLENKKVNDIWLCDKGWFGYEFTASPERLQSPMIRRGDYFEPIGWEDALNIIVDKIKAAIPKGKIAGWGGNPLSFEENYFFQQLMREGARTNHLDHRIGMPIFDLKEEGLLPGMSMPIGDCEQLDFAFLLGLDLTEEFPVIWLRLRQAINKGAEVTFAGHFAPEIASYFTNTLLHAPGQELDILKQVNLQIRALASQGKKGAIFVGRQYLANINRSKILSELMQLQDVSLNIMEGDGNSIGALMAGMRPDMGPLGSSLEKTGLNAIQVLDEAGLNGWEVLYVVGADPAVKFPESQWKSARSKLGFLIVQDLFLTETALQADIILPALCFAEKKGHFINIEGRVQKLEPGKEIPENIYSDAEIFTLLANKLNFSLWIDDQLKERLDREFFPFEKPKSAGSSTASHDEINDAKLRAAIPARKMYEPQVGVTEGSLREGSPGRGNAPLGKKDLAGTAALKASFSRLLFDQGVRMKQNPHLIQLAKESKVRINHAEGEKRGIRSGDPVRLTVNGNSITAKIKLDDRVADSTIVLPLGFEKIPVHNLANNLLNGLPVEIVKI